MGKKWETIKPRRGGRMVLTHTLSAPVAPLGLKAVADSVENTALKGRSSTGDEMSEEIDDISKEWRL